MAITLITPASGWTAGQTVQFKFDRYGTAKERYVPSYDDTAIRGNLTTLILGRGEYPVEYIPRILWTQAQIDEFLVAGNETFEDSIAKYDPSNIGRWLPVFYTWETSHFYGMGSWVTNGGSYYYCLTAHTSGVFATDLAAGKWDSVSQYADEYGDEYAEVISITPYYQGEGEDDESAYWTEETIPGESYTMYLYHFTAFEEIEGHPFYADVCYFSYYNGGWYSGEPNWFPGYSHTFYTWQTNKTYAQGSRVRVDSGDSYYYRSLVHHKSGIFADDLAAGKWVLVEGIEPYYDEPGGWDMWVTDVDETIAYLTTYFKNYYPDINVINITYDLLDTKEVATTLGVDYAVLTHEVTVILLLKKDLPPGSGLYLFAPHFIYDWSVNAIWPIWEQSSDIEGLFISDYTVVLVSSVIPDPEDNATNTDYNTQGTVSWTGGTSPYNVYFGPTGSETLVSSEQTETHWHLPTLKYNTEYTWWVNDYSHWTFTTIPFYTPNDRVTSKQLVAAAADKIWLEDI